MKWKVEEAYHKWLLRDYLNKVKKISRRTLRVLKYDQGQILVNDELTSVNRTLERGDCIQIIFPKENRGSFLEPEDIPLNIIFEDDDVLVLNKEPGIATIPSHHHQKGTLANGVIAHYDKQQLPYTIHVVTRLDRDTSGLLLIAKHRYSHSILSEEQKLGKINRLYEAIISGKLKNDSDSIELPIARNPNSIVERIVAQHGQHAVTHYKVEKEGHIGSLLEIRLETGRTHQIRVHFASIGHPLLGDDLYGGDHHIMKRQALHCKSLAFNHPLTGERLEFQIELPEDMIKVLKFM